MSRDPRVDAYIALAQPFARPILDHLLARFHAVCPEIQEGIKWSMPFFQHGDRPIANMAAFKAHASFGFWNRKELATGQESEAMGQYGRLTGMADLPADDELDATIRMQLALAASPNRPKRAPRERKPEAEVPPTLAAAIARDAAARATFEAFSPSHRREYCEWVAAAKREETRDKRIAQTLEWLREGKQRNWKYANC